MDLSRARTLLLVTLWIALTVLVLGESENSLEELEMTQSTEEMQQQDNTTTITSNTTITTSTTTTSFSISSSSSSSSSSSTSSTSTSTSTTSSTNSNTPTTTKATDFASHQSTSTTSTERSIELGSDIARNAGPTVTSTTSTTAKPTAKRQISLAEFQKLVAKVNDEIQLLRNQSIHLSRTYDDLVHRYNERISQMSIQMEDGTERTPGTTSQQILSTTDVPSTSLATNGYPSPPIADDRHQPSYLTNICGNNYYNYIHYYMYPFTDDQLNLVAAQGQGRRGGPPGVHQLAPGRQPGVDNELDQRYDSAASSESWQPAPFHPRSDLPPPPPPSAVTSPPTLSTPKRLEEFLARHKITLEPVVLATSPPIPITTTPIPLEKVLTVEHPPYLALTIPTTAKPVPGNSRNGWDGFDFQFVRKAMESKRRAEVDGVGSDGQVI